MEILSVSEIIVMSIMMAFMLVMSIIETKEMKRKVKKDD